MLETGTIDLFQLFSDLTETYDIAFLRRREYNLNRINEALLKELMEVDQFNVTSFLERDVTQKKDMLTELLKTWTFIYEVLVPPPITDIGELINMQREENLRTYNELKSELHKRYIGKYVVIAQGKLQAVGESFDDIKDVALDANHRFIFKVERKKKAVGLIRWPMVK